jgi:hypothetical protein
MNAIPSLLPVQTDELFDFVITYRDLTVMWQTDGDSEWEQP